MECDVIEILYGDKCYMVSMSKYPYVSLFLTRFNFDLNQIEHIFWSFFLLKTHLTPCNNVRTSQKICIQNVLQTHTVESNTQLFNDTNCCSQHSCWTVGVNCGWWKGYSGFYTKNFDGGDHFENEQQIKKYICSYESRTISIIFESLCYNTIVFKS